MGRHTVASIVTHNRRKRTRIKRRTQPGFAGVYASAKRIARWKAAWFK